MNIEELKEILSRYPDDTEIYTSSDPEGNRIESVFAVTNHLFLKEDGKIEILHPEDAEGFELEELIEVLVIWP